MKTLKSTLIIAMAICGASNANAKDLSEAIKNVDISGSVVYRYNDYEGQGTENQYKLATSLKSKVNDDVTFTSRFIVGDKTGQKVFNTTSEGDSQMDVSVSEVKFSYTGVKNTIFTLGKQGIISPFTKAIDTMGDEQTGTGIYAMTSWGIVSLNAAYYNQTNFKDSGWGVDRSAIDGNNFITLGANISVEGFNFDVHYADSEDAFDMYTVGVDYSNAIGDFKFKPFARYSALDKDNSSLDNNLWKVGLKVNKDIYGAFIAYGQTDDEGGSVGIDGSSKTGFDEHWRLALSGVSDASMLFANVDAQITPKFNLALKYSGLETSSDSQYDSGTAVTDRYELYLQASYKMSANLLTYIRFGELDIDDDETHTIGRLHIQYSF
jgi:hypothetical protein